MVFRGYVLEANGFAVAPIILGIVLGPLLETNFTTSMMIARGDLWAFFERPVAAALGISTIAIWGIAIASGVILSHRRRKSLAGGAV